MARGPAGFPRVTNIGPFSDTEAKQEFSREVIEDGYRHSDSVDREVSSIHSIDLDNVTRVLAELVVRESVHDGDGSIMDAIRTEIDIATRGERIAKMTYWMSDDIAKVVSVDVAEDFRSMGIGTRLKEKELEFMDESGVEIVYTDIISEGGYRLAKTTDFRPIHKAKHLRGTESTLHFGNRRGVMFKYL